MPACAAWYMMAQRMGSSGTLDELVMWMRQHGVTKYSGSWGHERVTLELGPANELPPMPATEPRRKTQEDVADEDRAERQRVRNVTRAATSRIA